MPINSSLLKRSFQPIVPIAADFAEHFFDDLFMGHPELRSLVSIDQATTLQTDLVQKMAFVIERIETPEELSKYLHSQGQELFKHGGRIDFLDWFGQSLINTLHYFYADNWTDELHALWSQAYGMVAEYMNKAIKTEVELSSLIQKQTSDLADQNSLPTASLNLVHDEPSQVVPASNSASVDKSSVEPSREKQLRHRIDQLASEVLYQSMEKQAHEVAARVIGEMKDTFFAQMVQSEIKKQATFWVEEILKSAVEAEANRLISDRFIPVSAVA